MLKSAERSDRRRRRTRRSSRQIKLTALARSLGSGRDGSVASVRFANDDSSTANPLGDCDDVGDLPLVALLRGQRSGVALGDGLGVTIDDVVAVLVELRNEAVSNVLARRVRGDP